MSYATKIWAFAASAILLASCGQKEAEAPIVAPQASVVVSEVETAPVTATASSTATGETQPAATPATSTGTTAATGTGTAIAPVATTKETMLKYSGKLTTLEGSTYMIEFEYPATYKIKESDDVVVSVISNANEETYIQFQPKEGEIGEPFCATYEKQIAIGTNVFKKYYTAESCVPVPSVDGKAIAYTVNVKTLDTGEYLSAAFFWNEEKEYVEILASLKITKVEKSEAEKAIDEMYGE